MTKLRVGVYPGTFDPITKGHMDIVIRAAALVDKLVVAVVDNTDKDPLFDAAERVAMVEAELQAEFEAQGADHRVDDRQVEVRAFDNLLTHFARQVEATVIIRGLRAVSDFEYEFQMTGMNRRLNPDVETVFLMASEAHQFIASRLIKEIARLGGDISPFVSPRVTKRLAKRIAERRRSRK